LEHFERVQPEHVRFVEEDVAEAAAEDDAERRPKQEIVYLRHAERRAAGRPQAVAADQPDHPAPAEDEADNVGERVPAQRERADLGSEELKPGEGKSRWIDIWELKRRLDHCPLTP